MATEHDCASASAKEKANEFAVEALKQLLAIAGALLALTITFLKDILGGDASEAQYFFLVPTGWVFLCFSIWWGWTAIAEAAKWLGTGRANGYAFGEGMPRCLAKLAQYTFFAGVVCLGLFVTLNISHSINEGHYKSNSSTKNESIMRTAPAAK